MEVTTMLSWLPKFVPPAAGADKSDVIYWLCYVWEAACILFFQHFSNVILSQNIPFKEVKGGGKGGGGMTNF